MTLTHEQARALWIACWPDGARELYGLDDRAGDPSKHFDAVASVLKMYGTDALDSLRTDLLASTTTNLLAEWEATLGLSNTRAATAGTTSQRVGQIVARLRERGTPTLGNIKAALAAICGYEPDILEHSRNDIDVHVARQVNAYPIGGPGDPINAAGTTTYTTSYGDVGLVSNAGARVYLWISHAATTDLILRLFAPSGAYKEWNGITDFHDNEYRILWWPECAGLSIGGTWTLEWANAGATVGEIIDCTLVADSIGRAAPFSPIEGSGAQMFHWSAAIDESLCGSSYDRNAALDIVRRWNPAHCICGVALYMVGGGLCAIVDDPNCIADFAVAC